MNNDYSAEAAQSSPDLGTPFSRILKALLVVCTGVAIGYFVFTNASSDQARFPFKLGLDLAGGSQLMYEADVSEADPQEVPELMSTLRDVIERRINVFGVSEPIVQVEQSSFVSDETKHRLLVELPGVTDVSDAVAEIGRTPLLEFKLIDQEALAAQQTREQIESSVGEGAEVSNVEINGSTSTNPYLDTGLTGRYLESAQIDFAGQNSGGGVNQPIVLLNFNSEGGDLFEEITANNTGERLAIFLDGEILSSPRINERIAGGTAQISGSFTPEEARELAQNLNFGALPIPIELVSTQTIGATLGEEVLDDGISAGIIGASFIVAFLLLWYRVPGVVAIAALSIYVAAMLVLFMLIPVTLTAAGLAGFILSLGMAVDANVLVFERMKEVYRSGVSSRQSAYEGFARAWSAIRDGNLTSLLSAVLLFWFGTSLVKGFALVFGMGIIVSMVTAVFVTRTLLLVLPDVSAQAQSKLRAVFDSGISK